MDICFGLHQIFSLYLPPLCQNASRPCSPQKWLPRQSNHMWNVLLFTSRIPYLTFPCLFVSLLDQLLAPTVLLPRVSCPPGAIAPLWWSLGSVLGVKDHLSSLSLAPPSSHEEALLLELLFSSRWLTLVWWAERRLQVSLAPLNSTHCPHSPRPIPRCSLQFWCLLF